MDLVLDEYVEFTVDGDVGVDLTGYYEPDVMEEMMEDEEGGTTTRGVRRAIRRTIGGRFFGGRFGRRVMMGMILTMRIRR